MKALLRKDADEQLALVEAAIAVGSIPVIASLGETRGGQILNVNADWAANELVTCLRPYKIIFLTGTGGLLDRKGKLIDSINLSTEYEELMRQPWVHGGMRVKLEQIHDLGLRAGVAINPAPTPGVPLGTPGATCAASHIKIS